MHTQMKKNETKYAQIDDPEAVSDIVGMSAVMVQDMSARRVPQIITVDQRLFFQLGAHVII
jgi:arginyl-tRNA synthetase